MAERHLSMGIVVKRQPIAVTRHDVVIFTAESSITKPEAAR
jgi:hypothetical protein